MPFFIEEQTIGEAWLQSLRTVLSHGEIVSDDKGPIREVSPLYITLHNPPVTDPLIQTFGDPCLLAFMQHNFEDRAAIAGWGYSYAQRLYDYEGKNQVQAVTEQLRANPAAKSATLSLLRPGGDDRHRPCLTTLDFKIRGEGLHLHAFFRSQDIGKKMYADALQLLRIGRSMKTNLSVLTVHLHLSVASAHVYVDDLPSLHPLLARFP